MWNITSESKMAAILSRVFWDVDIIMIYSINRSMHTNVYQFTCAHLQEDYLDRRVASQFFLIGPDSHFVYPVPSFSEMKETGWRKALGLIYLFIYWLIDWLIDLATVFIQDHPVQLKAGLNGGCLRIFQHWRITYRENQKLQTINTCKDQKSLLHKCLLKFFLKSESELSCLK